MIIELLYMCAVLTTVVFVHELGHYLLAILLKIKVLKFSIGFGPALWKYVDKNSTVWQVSMLPMGGYIMIDEHNDDRPAWKHLLVSIAGPIANFILTIITLMCLFYTVGEPLHTSKITTVQVDMPAAKVGMQTGARICSINGHAVHSASDVLVELKKCREDTKIIIQTQTLELENDKDNGLIKEYIIDHVVGEPVVIGVELADIQYQKITDGNMVWKPVMFCYNTMVGLISAIANLLQANNSSNVQLGGPISLLQMLYGVASGRDIMAIIVFMTHISASLGCFNLLPIPGLDGGRACLSILEIIKGSRFRHKTLEIINVVSTFFIIGLMLTTSLLDIKKIISWLWSK